MPGVFFLLMIGCGAAPLPQQTYEVPIAGKKITLSQTEWREMDNETTFAKNFEAVSNPQPRQYQIVTVFMIPMSDDRRSGDRLSPNEYLEVFVSNPNEITVLLRRDHVDYWVLSREMFKDVNVPGVLLANGAALTDADAERVAGALRAEIDRTRCLLGERLRAH